MAVINKNLIENIQMLACDLDGVLTDGRIWLGSDGHWKRAFCVRDGVGIKRLQEAGYKVAIITLSDAEDVRKRVTYLGVDYFYEKILEKTPSFMDLLKKTNLQANQVAYMGDDIPDLPILQKCGWSISVPNGSDEVKEAVHYVTKSPGGLGAVREVCEILLKYGYYSNK